MTYDCIIRVYVLKHVLEEVDQYEESLYHRAVLVDQAMLGLVGSASGLSLD